MKASVRPKPAGRSGILAAACLLLSGGLSRSAAPPVMTPGTGPSPAESRIAVRSGDAAPVTARFTGSFACRLAAAPAGGLLFTDDRGTAIYARDAGGDRVVAHAGDETADGARLASLCDAAAGGDGAVSFRAALADGRAGIFRIAPGEERPGPVVVTGQAVPLRDGPATVAAILGPAAGTAGEIVAAIDFLEGPSAILRIPPGGEPETLLQTGDPLGGGLFQRATTAPAVNGAGTVVFSAVLDTGIDVVATIAPGAAPVILFQGTAPPGQPLPSAGIAPPAINDAGQVAFLWASLGVVRLQRVSSGSSLTIAAPGSPAPGGGTFTEITDLPPAIDTGGGVLFGAVRSNRRSGLYMFRTSSSTVAETGGAAFDGATIIEVGIRSPQPAPAFAADGSIWFAARSAPPGGTASGALFARPASGAARAEVRAGDVIPGETRFASFLEWTGAYLGGGPSIAPGGRMIFDARLTGGRRGLFARDGAGRTAALVIDGDPAPGGGFFDGPSISYHSINAAGAAAFLAAARDSEAGTAGTGGMGALAPPVASPSALYLIMGDGAPVTRLIGLGDPEPGGDQTVAGMPPISRINRSGALAVPLLLSDGLTVLFGYAGGALFRVAGPGDPAPGGSRLTQIFTGSLFLGLAVPPILGDDGTVFFGATTDAGDAALFAARLAPGGGGITARVIGQGDAVEGGTLAPFEAQAFDVDAAGRIAIQAVFDANFSFGTFLAEGGGAAAAVARPFDLIDDLGFVFAVMPRLALPGDGRVAHAVRLFGGAEVVLLRPAGGTGPAETLAASGGPSPDGGIYRSFQTGVRSTARLSSDGRGSVAFAAATTAGPEAIVIYGAPANRPPVADAGPGRIVECSGPGGAIVRLDGGGSSDADGDPLSYRWTGPFGDAEGVTAEVRLPLGVSIVTLVVSDGREEATDTVSIEVRDTTPPSIEVSAAIASLWPPDGRMVEIPFAVRAADLCDAAPAVALVAVDVDDAPGGRPGASVGGAAIGADDRLVSLRADRSGTGTGRLYRVTYRAADASGNAATATALVAVPHDQRR